MDLEESKRALSSTLNNVLAPIVTEGGADSGPACQLREDLASILAQQVPILLKRDLEAFQLAKRFRGLTNHPAYSAATRALLVEASGVAATLMEQVEVDLAEQIEIAERASPSPIREELVDLEGTIVGYPLAEVVGQTVQAVCHSLVESGPRLIESEFESIESLSLYHEPFNSDWGNGSKLFASLF